MVPHISDILKNKSVAIVLLAAVDCAGDLSELKELYDEIGKIVAKPLKESENDESEEVAEEGGNDKTEESSHPICDACGHWVVKSIVQKDKARVEASYSNIFVNQLCDLIPAGSFADWAVFNRGAFVLVSLLETEIESVVKRVKEDLALLPKLEAEGKGIDLLKKVLDK